MIDIKTMDQSPIIEITLYGKIVREDIEKVKDVFEQKITEQEPINILLHAESLDSITFDGLWEDLKMAKYLRSMAKAAIVSDKEWLKADAQLENLFPNVKVEHFAPNKQHTALAWLKS